MKFPQSIKPTKIANQSYMTFYPFSVPIFQNDSSKIQRDVFKVHSIESPIIKSSVQKSDHPMIIESSSVVRKYLSCQFLSSSVLIILLYCNIIIIIVAFPIFHPIILINFRCQGLAKLKPCFKQCRHSGSNAGWNAKPFWILVQRIRIMISLMLIVISLIVIGH